MLPVFLPLNLFEEEPEFKVKQHQNTPTYPIYGKVPNLMDTNQRFKNAGMEVEVNISMRIAEQSNYRLPSVPARLYAEQEKTQDTQREKPSGRQLSQSKG